MGKIQREVSVLWSSRSISLSRLLFFLHTARHALFSTLLIAACATAALRSLSPCNIGSDQ